MVAPRVLAFLAVYLPATVGQSTSNTSKVWSVVAFINHGETTPNTDAFRRILTPEGAEQLHRQGQAFRDRYLNAKESTYIQSIEPTVIDNSQMNILSQTDEWVDAGAMAFMQGLYPPAQQQFLESLGGMDLAHNFVGDQNASDYPMNGYQYPNIQTLGIYDMQSVAIQGSIRCPSWQSEANKTLQEQSETKDLYSQTLEFYQKLFSEYPLNGTFPLEHANLGSAYELYEYVNYMYAHNVTVHGDLPSAEATLKKLSDDAEAVERAKNTLLTAKNEDTNNTLHTIAGRTMAYKVAEQFLWYRQRQGASNKLTLMFGSHEPFIAFFALAGLLRQSTPDTSPFAALPKPGAAMVFELVGDLAISGSNESFNASELSVRFYYRPSADVNETFTRYSLFSADSGGDGDVGGATDIPYLEFQRIMMEEYGMSQYDWCDICDSNAPWCNADVVHEDDENGYGHGHGHGHKSSRLPAVSNAVAGILGAVIMLIILTILMIILYLCAGVRFTRHPSKTHEAAALAASAAAVGRGGGGGGGFKGAEKKDEDRDVAVNREGTRHERVGSWEMRAGGAGILTTDLGRQSLDGDGISILHAQPVKAYEGV